MHGRSAPAYLSTMPHTAAFLSFPLLLLLLLPTLVLLLLTLKLDHQEHQKGAPAVNGDNTTAAESIIIHRHLQFLIKFLISTSF